MQTEKTSVNAATEDMASVSTFTTIGNMPLGSSRTNESDNETSSRRRRRQLAGGKVKNGRGSVVAVACMIVFLGLIAGTALAYLGFRAEKGGRVEDFQRGALITVAKIRDSFDEYVDTASLIHGRFRHRPQFDASAFELDQESYTADYMEWSREFRKDFRELYEYVRASGLKFKAMQFDPNITLQERPVAEAEADIYYMENYPEVNYTGFRGFNGDSTSLKPRWWNQSFYFPIHYMEPIPGNEAAIDLDYYSSESRIRAVKALFETKEPSLTDRLSLVKKAGSVSRCISGDEGFSGEQGPSFGVVLMHPGVKLSEDDEMSWPREFSSIVLCMSDLMKRSTDHLNRKISVYIHDLSHPTYDAPVFMGAARLDQNETATEAEEEDDDTYVMSLRNEIPLAELECAAADACYQQTIDIANRKWTVTILDEHGQDKYRLVYVVLVGLVVFIAFLCLAIWVLATDRKNRNYSALKAQAAAERNSLVLENANRAAQTERELNDFLAHEVRNPLAAAMAATTFLRTQLEQRTKSTKAVHVHFEDSDESEEFVRDETNGGFPNRDDSVKTLSSPRLVQAREDVQVVDNSLRFINDLLRTMLDMHRATSGNLQVKLAPVDLLRDVLEPVAGMLHRGGEGNIGRGKGGEKVQIVVDCPEDIVVATDVLRLKQVILNLGRNSVKFINEGFIRLRAEVLEVECSDDPDRFRDQFVRKNSHLDIECGSTSCKTVRIYVEDSGSGIPIEKRERLFAKYQESLDLLSQGTGIGLHLCKNLVGLMGGRISLDNDYDSGIPDNPGARFVIDLQTAPSDTSLSSIEYDRDASIHVNFVDETNGENGSKLFDSVSGEATSVDTAVLPESLNVLFVDDDRVLRKLFARTIKMVAPGWSIREAANGEAAILLADEEDFDLIFCDMYMASVEKQLLGTETVAELRSKGLKCRICGLSANDKEREFLEAGADAFLFKPIPCEANMLRKTLYKVIYEEHQ